MVKRSWNAREALSWGMYGDETTILSPNRNTSSQPIRSYNDARRQLRDAIAVGNISAQGFRRSGNKPPLARETISSELFEQFASLAVDATGETTFLHPSSPEDTPQWTGIVFDSDEVRTLWPKPTPDIDAWMLNDFQARPDEKRESRVADCRSATGCTHKQALAAYARIPSNLKRSRGQRISKRTS
jgi:hypothetical protein